ncbi:hypothetical protein HD806DRAFT_534391 [Xylariaceae sp. AK1471]|nr:hypothetical protein HD806DRAFT_534391 [Xylariaceae sp. AK1471]
MYPIIIPALVGKITLRAARLIKDTPLEISDKRMLLGSKFLSLLFPVSQRPFAKESARSLTTPHAFLNFRGLYSGARSARRMRIPTPSAAPLIMPTKITPSNPYPLAGATSRQQSAATNGKLENTSLFNGTGHPAPAMPIGLVVAKEDSQIKLLASL